MELKLDRSCSHERPGHVTLELLRHLHLGEADELVRRLELPHHTMALPEDEDEDGL